MFGSYLSDQICFKTIISFPGINLLRWQLRRSACWILPHYRYMLYVGHDLHPCDLWARIDWRFMNSPRIKTNAPYSETKIRNVMGCEYQNINLDRSSLALSIWSNITGCCTTKHLWCNLVWFGPFLLFERYIYLILFIFHLFYTFHFH